MSEKKQLINNSRTMVLMTTLSRVFGLVRDQVIAFLLGTSAIADAWHFSFQLPNLFRRLIAEGAMSTAFVPLLAELDAKADDKQVLAFARAVFSLVLLAATVIVSLIVLLIPWLLPIFLSLTQMGQASGTSHPELVILASRVLAPYLVFISLSAICQGLLNVKNRFALPAATPIFLNLAIIAFGLGLRNNLANPIWGLATGVLVGGCLQLGSQWFLLRRLGFTLKPTSRLITAKTMEALRLWLPSTFGAGIYQINLFVSNIIAVGLMSGALSALTHANRLIELFLGIFSVAMSTALLPILAKARAQQDQATMNQGLWTSLSMMSLISIPAAFGLVMGGEPIIRILFQRGEFDAESVRLTYAALIFHSISLLPVGWYRIAVQSFYAHKQVSKVVQIAGVGAMINISGCLLFPRLFPNDISHAGIALATAVSSWFLCLTTLFLAIKRFSLTVPRPFLLDALKVTAASCSMTICWLGETAQLPLSAMVWRIGGSVLIFAGLALLLRVSPMIQLARYLQRKGKPI